MDTKFKKGQLPWNKGTTGVMSAWNKGIRKIPFTTKACEVCHSTYERGPKCGDQDWLKRKFCSKSCKSRGNKYRLGHKHSVETRKKMSDSHPKGELSPIWRKDRTEHWLNKDRRSNLDYKLWRESVFSRDEFKCRIADKNCVNYMEAHHILSWREYPELRYQITNGITLCRSHHPKGREKEKRLAPLFQELVSVSKKQIFLG